MSNPRLFDRAVLRLSPMPPAGDEPAEDVAGFLQGLVTADVKGPLPVWSGLLTPQGKALFDFIVWREGDDILLDAEAQSIEGLARRLTLYRLRRRIAIARDESIGVFWRAGEGPSPDPRLPDLGQRWLGPIGADDHAVDAEWLAHRLALGVAEGVGELGSDQTLWLETNAAELGGVSFTKGCYVGQENTARMNWRQKVNRRLVVVPIALSRPDRRRVVWDDLGLALDHLRIEDIARDMAPPWLARVMDNPAA